MSILTDRVIFSGSPASNDLIHIVDVSDPTDNPAGTSFAIGVGDLVPSIPFTSLTTTGTTGPSTLISGTLNVPEYAGVTFTGNTSGDCITDLYITNLYGCSPITIHDTVTYVDSIIDSETTNSFIFGDSHVLTASTGTHGTSFDSNVMLGGSTNKITPSQIGRYNAIIGGDTNEIGGGSRVENNIILGSTNSFVSTSYGSTGGVSILGGNNNSILGGGNSAIIGGDNNTVLSGIQRAVILGGQNITGTTNDTVYVPNLVVQSGKDITSDTGGGTINLQAGLNDLFIGTNSGTYTGPWMYMSSGTTDGALQFGVGDSFGNLDIGMTIWGDKDWTADLTDYINWDEIIIHENVNNHAKTGPSDKRAVLIGSNNSVILSGVTNTVVIGGIGITGTTNDTVYVPNLNIGTVGTGTSVNNLGIDSSGNVVSATNEINDNLILEGTTNASTSQAIYGVNIITSATTSDLATRLPDPTTGRQTVFINNSLLPIKVFPSVVGGEINGVVDGVASIPNDGRTYTFYCTQNPLPGAWTWSAPAIQQIVLQEMEINHTNGVSSAGFNAGQGTANESSVGLGWGGSGVVETGTWNTNNFPAWVEKFKVYSNIKWADIAGGNINAFFTQGYQNAPTGTTSGNKAVAQFQGSQAFPGAGVQEVLGGTAGDNVGDIGTLYMELPFTNAYPLSRIIGNQAVTTPIPGNSETCYSKGYYTFEMNINSNSGTKLYKFQWFIEYS
jgi:hypothetical protein